jgi:MFS family permease
VTLFITANAVVVAVIQPWVNRLVERIGGERALRGAILCWVLATPVGAITVLVSELSVQIGALVIYSVIFALGETLIAPSMQPLAAANAPENALASYTGSISLAHGIGNMVGPAMMLPLLALVGGAGYWAIVAAGSALGLLFLKLFTHRRVQVLAGVAA